MAKFVLIGLVEPTGPEAQAAFDEWFVGEHIEDTARCPNFVRGAAYKLAGSHLGSETISKYLSIYEVEAPSYEEAEKTLNEWQRNPNAWGGRAQHTATRAKHGSIPMKIIGSGWYKLENEYPPSR